MPAAPSIGIAIKRARERKRWTQRQLAEALDVNIKSVDNWENSRTLPKNRLGALEQVLGVSLTEEPGAGPELIPTDEWEAEVLADPNLPDRIKRQLLSDSRAARAAYAIRRSGRHAAPATGRESAQGQAGA